MYIKVNEVSVGWINKNRWLFSHEYKRRKIINWLKLRIN